MTKIIMVQNNALLIKDTHFRHLKQKIYKMMKEIQTFKDKLKQNENWKESLFTGAKGKEFYEIEKQIKEYEAITIEDYFTEL